MENATREALGPYFEALGKKAPAEWEQLPDLGLYLDQVITFLERQLDFFRMPGDEGQITSSMINNYAKSGLVPRTVGKKYGQEHLALLLSVFALKRVLSVQDMAALLGSLGGADETKKFYGRFRESMRRAAESTSRAVGDALPGLAGEEALPDGKALRSLALELAADASMRSRAAELLLALAISGEAAAQPEKTKSPPKPRRAPKGEKA
ncbi:DUF1836 domain-containing protein [bacterium]|nr:DUF1836 domain-containing protein [bacterium]